MQAPAKIYQIRCPGCRCVLRISQAQIGKPLRCRQCAKKLIFRGPAQQQRVPAASGGPAQQATRRPVTQVAPTAAAPKAAAPVRPSAPAAKTTTRPAPKAPAAAAPAARQAPPKKPAPPPTAAAKPAPRPAPAPPRPVTPPAQPPAPPAVSRPAPPPRPVSAAKKDDEGYSPRQKLIAGGAAVAGVLALGWFFLGGSLAYVSGTVKLDDEPLDGAMITFVGESGKLGPYTAKSGAGGSYSLRSNTNTGIPPGKYKVTITKRALKDGSLPQDREELDKAVRSGTFGNIVKGEYEEASTTPLNVEVASGSNTHNFTVPRHPWTLAAGR